MVRKGSKMSEESKRKMSEARKGRKGRKRAPFSEETKRKISKTMNARRNQKNL